MPSASRAARRRARRWAACCRPLRGRGRAASALRFLGLFGGVEDFGDFGDEVEEFLTVGRVDRMLGGACGLGGAPHEVVEIRVLFNVLGFEVIGPQHPEVALY